ncbi:MAG: hypothetical protein ABEI80_08815 [Haloplanus sp.]
MALTRDEMINLGLLALTGILTGVGSFVFRQQLPTIYSVNLIQFQYSLAVMLLGCMPLLFLRAGTTEGRATAVYLTVALLIGTLVEPQQLLLNAMIGATVTVGGLAYFRFYGNSNVYLLGVIGLLLLDLYLYGLYVTWRAFARSGDLRISFAALFLTLVLLVLARMIKREYTKAVGGFGGPGGNWKL